jgi:hypothetical protein
VAVVFDVKVKDKDVAATCHDSPKSRPHKPTACSAVHSLGLISGVQAVGAMRWDGMAFCARGSGGISSLAETANPRAAQRNRRWGRALGARSGLCIERGRATSWRVEAEVSPLVRGLVSGYWGGLKSRANYRVAGLERIVEREVRV